jgi:hypothetical protein
MYKFHVTIDTIHGLSSVKPSPEGEGWVWGNQHREKT